MYTLTQTINFSQTYIEYSPLTAGAGFEPALSIASMIRSTIMNSPFTWPWNRNEWAIGSPNTPKSLTAGTQDYVFPITDFAYLEKVSLLSEDGAYGYELKDIYNRNILGVPAESAQAQPNAASVKLYIPGVSMALRFLSNPDQAYTGTLTYQKLALPFQQFDIDSVAMAAGGNTTYTGTFNPTLFTVGQPALIVNFNSAVNNGSFNIVSVTPTTLILANPNGVAETTEAFAINHSWYPIPDSFMDIFNNLFLAEAMDVVDATGQYYRQRGIAALLSKAEGLTEMQTNAFLAQWVSRGSSQMMGAKLRTQQGSDARGV